MREIEVVEAKNTLGALLDLVDRGEDVVITRRGKPVARLVRETDFVGRERDKARRAAADIIAASTGMSLGGLKIKDLIDAGRP